MKHLLFRPTLAIAAAVLLASCTMKDTDAPPLTGPSEFGTSITVSVVPDTIFQDGASQSLVTVTARDANGQPVRNLTLRAEIAVNGAIMDFGTLSARNIVTGSDGRATLVYTAPPSPGGFATDSGTVVNILVTPVGSDFGNALPRLASIRLVPPGIIVPPDGLQPRFTFTPSSPRDNEQVFFDASTSQAPSNNPIVRYEWNFGDGERGSGRTTGHFFEDPGTFIVTLTVFDAFGRSASTSQPITVGAGTAPTASFTFSPTEPLPGQQVNFNAAASRAATGRRIVSYTWDFGDGTAPGSGVQVSHTYTAIGTYIVTLTVTDDVGRTSVTTQEIPVGVSEDEEIAVRRGGS